MTWLWENKEHNVNEITHANFKSCNVNNTEKYAGDYVWTAPDEPGTHHFACGREFGKHGGPGPAYGDHCRNGNMRATIKVSENCTTT